MGREFQDNVLERLLDRRQVTTVFLRNRMTIRGRIVEYDAYALLMEPLDGTPVQLVYKSAVVSIAAPPPRRPPPRGRGDRPPRPGYNDPRRTDEPRYGEEGPASVEPV